MLDVEFPGWCGYMWLRRLGPLFVLEQPFIVGSRHMPVQ